MEQERPQRAALADTIVAAIALERSCTLMTDNLKDFPMEELDIFDLPRR